MTQLSVAAGKALVGEVMSLEPTPWRCPLSVVCQSGQAGPCEMALHSGSLAQIRVIFGHVDDRLLELRAPVGVLHHGELPTHLRGARVSLAQIGAQVARPARKHDPGFHQLALCALPDVLRVCRERNGESERQEGLRAKRSGDELCRGRRGQFVTA